MKVLIVGLGSIAKKHIEALYKINPSTQIFALRSSPDSACEEGIVNVYSEEEISKEIFDFAIISNPTYEHRNAISKLLFQKIPLFIEKPVFDKIGEEEENILELVSNSKIKTYVACNLRFLDSLQFIKNELEGKKINEVNIYCGSYLPDWRPAENFRKNYSANKEMGGGVHIDLIHELDYTYWIFGEPAQTKAIFTNSSTLAISSYDYANYAWQYENFTANIILNYYRKDAKRTLEIVCENGTYFINLLKNTVSFGDEIIFHSEQKISDTYLSQMDFFVNRVLKNEENEFNTIFEAYKILKICIEE